MKVSEMLKRISEIDFGTEEGLREAELFSQSLYESERVRLKAFLVFLFNEF